MNQPITTDPLEPAERKRSDFVRDLVQQQVTTPNSRWVRPSPIPKHIVQFWDDMQHLPGDVADCMNSWKQLEKEGFTIEVYDRKAASKFIRNRLGTRYEDAFDKCYHPSMMSDYFRYSYVSAEGGFYIDADDVYHGKPIGSLFEDGRMKLQPFCYDVETAQMLPAKVFTRPGTDSQGWIFYFNTTPLIAPQNHPIVERALLNATLSLEADTSSGLPEVQATTGPGNLTRSIFEVICEGCASDALMVLHDWEQTSTSKWPLSYRNDTRNWRLANQQAYDHPTSKNIK